MQAKISAGNDYLRLPRVTGGNLPAPAGNSHEVFINRVQADFFKTQDVPFYPVPNTLTKVTICCLWSQWWTLQIWFCSKKVGLFLAGSSNRYPKKQLAEKAFTTIKMIGNWLFSIFWFSQSYRVKESEWILRILWDPLVLSSAKPLVIFTKEGASTTYTVKLARAKLPANAGNFTCSSQVKGPHTQFTCVTCSLPVKTGNYTCFYAASTSRRIHAIALNKARKLQVTSPAWCRLTYLQFAGEFTRGVIADCLQLQVTLRGLQVFCLLLCGYFFLRLQLFLPAFGGNFYLRF